MDGGYSVANWSQIWMHTHARGVRTEWPDGGSLMDQPAIAVRVLELVGDGIAIALEAQAPAG